jgi:bacterioferritin-associated ferredoxin
MVAASAGLEARVLEAASKVQQETHMGLKAQCDKCKTMFETEEVRELSLTDFNGEMDREDLGMLCGDCVTELREFIEAPPAKARAA